MNNNNKKKNITSKENNSSNLFTFVRASDLPLKQKKEHLIKDLSEEQPSTPTTLQTMTEPCLLMCCEFVLAPVYQGASGRTCSLDKSICPKRLYADKDLFLNCFLRKRESNYQKKKNRENKSF